MRLKELTLEHLGSGATLQDLDKYRGAVVRYMCSDCGRDEEEAEAYLWGGGDFTARWEGTHCFYCHLDMDTDGELVPEVDDEAEWTRLAAQHHLDCEWIQSRAHRRENEGV